ncbi:MAG: TrkH family potassium uptake protein [Syntrophales bacterium]|jgi:trk system potassium uptake protein TrkH|nr:TrkH family potassium uptake protein [Syntrophales bacterium]
MNLRNIFHILGIFVLMIGAAMLPAFVISAMLHEAAWTAIGLASLVTMGAGLLMYVLIPRTGERISLSHREGFVIVTLAWVLASAFGGLPFLFSGVVPTFCDAFFETMSGFTTTGASVISNLDRASKGILFWRALTQWLGGMGIIILSIAILPILGVGGMQLFKAEIPSPVKDKITPRITETAKNLWLVYVAITAVEIVLLWLGGMSVFDAVCHAFATMATGGFSTFDASVARFNSLYIEIVIIVFMFVAGMNFTLHYRLFKGDAKSFFRDPEFHFYGAIVLVATALITLDLRFHYFSSLGESLRHAAFQVVSIITTTGFATYNFDQWPAPSKFILVLLMFIGGCAGSTGGAIKCLRFMVVIKQTFIELTRLIHPHAVISVKIAKVAVPPEIVSSIRSFFFLYIAIAMAAMLALTLLGVDMVTSISGVAATLGNVGPGLGLVNASSTYSELPQAAKWILSVCMLLGRLEIYTVLVLLVPDFWKK